MGQKTKEPQLALHQASIHAKQEDYCRKSKDRRPSPKEHHDDDKIETRSILLPDPY